MINIFSLTLTLVLVSCVLCDDRVHVALYYESICPYSREFVLNQLTPTFAKLHSIIALDLVPYGNARYTIVNETGGQYDVKFTCQHGVDECVGNEIQSCAVATLGAAESLALVNCMFASENWKTPNKSGHECATSLNYDWAFLTECSTSPLGRGIELLMARRTDQLSPPHTGVPWVTINGKHTDSIEEKALTDLASLVCDTYTGVKPQECA